MIRFNLGDKGEGTSVVVASALLWGLIIGWGFKPASPAVEPTISSELLATEQLVNFLETKNPAFRDTDENRRRLENELLNIESILAEFSPDQTAPAEVMSLIRNGRFELAEAALTRQVETLVDNANYEAAISVSEVILGINSLEFDTRSIAVTEELIASLQPFLVTNDVNVYQPVIYSARASL
ncbi:MAG: hypothetical protein V4603_15650 [Pseudomonadota bacterium]